jgi:hypothetical protein
LRLILVVIFSKILKANAAEMLRDKKKKGGGGLGWDGKKEKKEREK